ncbi:hypothetical protein J2Z28_004453 [Paenibacillus xylanexedens]|uniref:Uncharacterized protein n=1 Tax=Paenibacillus xylanexedens TaxID=528191 RepID=A0ABS4RZR9_PAEXY|nr:hypothetical protein [Paenibacillus xylanexedens]
MWNMGDIVADVRLDLAGVAGYRLSGCEED